MTAPNKEFDKFNDVGPLASDGAASDAIAPTVRRRPGPRRLPEPYFILRAELKRLVPYSIQHILRLEKRGLFPCRVAIGINRVAWVRSEVTEWIEMRLRQRTGLRR